jgi:predicted site-specific integrase-resolvase
MTEFCEKVGLHRSTVINLEKKGIIKPLRTPGGVRRFTDEHVKQVYEYYYRKNVSNMNNKRVVVYCRVSTKKQEDYLKNQIEACKNFAISNGLVVTDVITDIASSFNFSRNFI